MERNLVSVIMLACNSGRFLEASVKSLFAQTYRNWELLFVDDASKDDTLHRIMDLRDNIHEFKISQCVFSRGETVNRNSALKDARGKYIAFLDAGDIWEPNKLEKQVEFMEKNNYLFSYSNFGCIDENGKQSGVVISGPDCVTYNDLKKCCWMGYLTVMYDREKVGLLQINGMDEANDYALWLQVAKKADCHLLPECLASQMLERGLWDRLFTSPKWIWRYEAYRKIVGMNPLVSACMTIRNLAYTTYKWWKYAKRS